MDWQWSEFLGRPDAPRTAHSARAVAEGRSVLITGAGGSIGNSLAEAVLAGDPRRLVLLDNSEYALYEALRKLSIEVTGRTQLIPVLGDVLSPGFLANVLQQQRPDLIYHAAAYKQVPLLEGSPFAAIRNNALGTFRLVQAVIESGGCDLILLSTDKAVEPRSIMGVSKRIAELAVLAQGHAGSNLCVVRLSNVLSSSGSVVPLFAEQLEQGVALTVTHPGVHRYLITANEASHALLLAASARIPGKVLIQKSGRTFSILALAQYMSGRYHAQHTSENSLPAAAEIRIIGLRPGEKLLERLTSPDETLEQTLPSNLQVFRSSGPEASDFRHLMTNLEHAVDRFDEAALHTLIDALVPESTWPAERARRANLTAPEQLCGLDV